MSEPKTEGQYDSTAVDFREVPGLADAGLEQLCVEAEAKMLQIELLQEELASDYRPRIQMLVELYATDPKFKTIAVGTLLRITQTETKPGGRPRQPNIKALRLDLERRGVLLEVIDASIKAATPPKKNPAANPAEPVKGITITRLGPSPGAKEKETPEDAQE